MIHEASRRLEARRQGITDVRQQDEWFKSGSALNLIRLKEASGANLSQK